MTEKSSRLNEVIFVKSIFAIKHYKLQCERQTSREQSHNFVSNLTSHIQSIGLFIT